jgi:hypothetical protein
MRAIEIVAEKKYRRRAIVGAILFTLFIVVLFFLVGFTEPDPLPIDIEEVQEIELDGSNIEFDAPSAGGGDPAISENDVPKPVEGIKTPTEESSEVAVSSGSGNVDKPASKPTIDQGLSFPGMSGDGGTGGGSGGGNGSGIGSGNGDFGSGNGGGSGTRSIVSNPCIKSGATVSGKIYLIVYVDASGKVTSAKNDPSRSTTGNKTTISVAQKAVLDCLKFEPRPGSGLQTIHLKKPIEVKQI